MKETSRDIQKTSEYMEEVVVARTCWALEPKSKASLFYLSAGDCLSIHRDIQD